MSRDYRHGHSKQNRGFQRRSQQQAVPDQGRTATGKIWLIGALVSVNLLGGFLIAKHFMSSNQAQEPVAPSEIYTEVTEPVRVEASSGMTVEALPSQPVSFSAEQLSDETDGSETKYSFYQGLKATEVLVDAVPISVALESDYYILAGTFGSEKVALQEQKRLAKLDQAVKVTAIANRGRTLYRLTVGPFSDRLIMNAKRNELRRLGVDTLYIKAN